MSLDIWTIYDSPSDYPGQAVARRFAVTAEGATGTDDVLVAASIKQVKRMVQDRMPYLLTFLPPSPGDEPQIIGCLL